MDTKYSQLFFLLGLILFVSAGVISAEAATCKNLNVAKLYSKRDINCAPSGLQGTAFRKTIRLKKKSCVLVKVSSEIEVRDLNDNGLFAMTWLVYVNGVFAQGPAYFRPPVEDVWTTFTGNYWIGKLPKGNHLIEVVFNRQDAGDDVCVYIRTLEIHYAE